MTAFRRWLGVCYGKTPDAPRDASQLAAFDPWRLLPAFRSDYAAGKVYANNGLTVEEGVLSNELVTRWPHTCLLATQYADQPTGHLRRVRIADARALAESCVANLARLNGGAVQAQAWLGTFGHSVSLHGAEAARQSLVFVDNQSERSLIPGAEAIGGTGMWRISADRFAEIVVALIVPEPVARRWEPHLRPGDPATPINIAENWTGPGGQTEQEELLRQAMVVSAGHPGSRGAEARSAAFLAEILLDAEMLEESVFWIRRAALMGSREGAHLLSQLSSTVGNQLESAYWNDVLEHGDPLFETEPDTDQPCWPPAPANLFLRDQGQSLPPAQAFDEAVRLRQTGQADQAVALFRRLVAEGNAESAPLAQYHLGELLLANEPWQAAEHFRAATLSRYLPIIVGGALRYARARGNVGDENGLRSGLFRAAFSGLPGAPELPIVQAFSDHSQP